MADRQERLQGRSGASGAQDLGDATTETNAPERLRSIVAALDEGVLVQEADGTISLVNSAAERILGRSAAELLAQPPEDLFRAADPLRDDDCPFGADEHPVAVTLRTGRAQRNVELGLRRPDGSRVWISSNSEAVRPSTTGQIVAVVATLRDITEQRRLDREARESEEKFATTFRVSPLLMALTRLSDGRILEVNESYERLLGYTRAESVGKRTGELSIWAQPEDRAVFVDELSRSGEVRAFETTLRRKDGTLVPVLDAARRVDIDGEPCLISAALDITHSKQAQADLARVNRALRLVNAANQALLHQTDETALLAEICRVAVEIGEYRMAWAGLPEQGPGQALRPIAHAGFDSGFLAAARGTWADDERGRGPTGTAVRTQRPCILHDLSNDPGFAPWREAALERGYQSIIALPLVAGGEVLGTLSIYSATAGAFDSSEVGVLEELAADLAFGIAALRTRQQKEQAEAALSRHEAQLNESQRLARIGSWDWNAMTDTIWWSPEYYRIYGLDPDLPTPSYLEHLQAYTPASAALLDELVRRAMERGEPYTVDLELAHPTPETKWIVARGEAKRDETGQIVGLRGTSQDITERRDLQDELRRINAELENRVEQRTAELAEAVRELEAFSYSVSHDLRAPLRAIHGYASLLEELSGTPVEDERTQLLRSLRTNATRMGQLIDDLLTLSRSSRAQLSRARLDMNALARDVLAELIPTGERSRIELQVAPLPDAFGDPALIRVVLQNLLSNALKYSAPRTIPHIEVGACPGAGGNEYYVKDNGVGFDPRYLNKLFGVFERLHSAAEFEGTGIGLALVKRIVTRHGGTVRAEGAIDRGATFSFTLAAPPEGTP